MNKRSLFLLAGAFSAATCTAQIDWYNYSTSYMGDGEHENPPLLMVAVPYNGNYSTEGDRSLRGPVHWYTPGDSILAGDSAELLARADRKMSNEEASVWLDYMTIRSRDQPPGNHHVMNTSDSSEVYFFGPGIHPGNAARYEFRVLLNGETELSPWNGVKQFSESWVVVNSFQKDFAFFGGFRTTWGNYLVAELREKGSRRILSGSAVYWSGAWPALLNIYPSSELNAFLQKLKKPYEQSLNRKERDKWKSLYTPGQIDSNNFLPRKLILPSDENSVIFYLTAGIYKKEALEYRLLRDGAVNSPWRVNDFDNNFIWLRNLSPGSYMLQMRYRAQRHNVTEYPFEKKPAWNQTLLFKIIAGVLVILALGAVLLLVKLIGQRRKTRIESSKKEKLNLELKSIRSQLNPHFIFNALSSIQGLINKNKIAAANNYLSEFGSLLRNSLVSNEQDFTDLGTEIKTLDTYLRLEQLRFGFRYTIRVDPSVSVSETDIPSFLLQPLVENAVRHGVSALQEGGLIRIDFQKENNNFIASVQDNGAGVGVGIGVGAGVGEAGAWGGAGVGAEGGPSGEEVVGSGEEARGYGLKLTTERIQVLNELLKGQSISFTLTGKEGTGTIARLLFSNWL